MFTFSTNMRAIAKVVLLVGVLALATILVACTPSVQSAERLTAPPAVAFPEKFKLELFADLAQFPGFPKAFYMMISNGNDSIPAGLYVTSGPAVGSLGTESDRIFHIDESGNIDVVVDGIAGGNEALVVAAGGYGEGLLFTAPNSNEIFRISYEENTKYTVSTFATSVGTMPFGPTGMAYGPDGFLYVADAAGMNLLRLYPDGTTTVLAKIPAPENLSAAVAAAKPVAFDAYNYYGGGLLTGLFTANGVNPTGDGVIYSVVNGVVSPLFSGLDGLEFLTNGPGGIFGDYLFVAVQGTDLPSDGAVYTLTPQGELIPFVNNIDAAHVVFDVEGVLGGGMFIADFNNGWDNGEPHPAAGKIWRVTPIE